MTPRLSDNEILTIWQAVEDAQGEPHRLARMLRDDVPTAEMQRLVCDIVRAVVGAERDREATPKKSAVKHGCHCDLEPGMHPDGCVLDDGRPEDCRNAQHLVAKGKGRDDCSEWRPVVFVGCAS